MSDQWETFCDVCYYHMWRLRRKTERGWNDGFHINTKAEAEGLRELLNKLEREHDEALSDLEFRRDLFQLQEQQLNDVRAERDRMGRELAEARELLDAERKHHWETTVKWNGHHMELTMVQCDLNKSLRERDEAREARDALLAENNLLHEQLRAEQKASFREERDKALCELEMWRDGNIMHESHRNEIQVSEQQRDRLAEALRELCETLLKDKPRDITELLNKAGDALAAVKGGSDD